MPGFAESWEPSASFYGGAKNLATGNLTLQQKIAGWEGKGPSPPLTLFFNSQSTESGPLGPKWRHGYQTRASLSGSNVVLTEPDGQSQVFTPSGNGYVSPAGRFEKLTSNSSGGYTLTHTDGSQRSFAATGRLVGVSDAFGNALAFTYTADLLSTISEPSGRTMTLSYVAGKLTTVTNFDGRIWTLSYNANGRLASISDPAVGGQTYGVSFAYNGEGNVSALTNRLGKTWQYSYQGNVLSYQTDPLGKVSGTVAHAGPAEDFNQFNSGAEGASTPDQNAATYPIDTVATSYVEDEAGRAAEYGMDATGRITAMRDGTGAQTKYVPAEACGVACSEACSVFKKKKALPKKQDATSE